MHGIEALPEHGRIGKADDVRMRHDGKPHRAFADIREEGVEAVRIGIALLVDDDDLTAAVLVASDGILVVEIDLRFAAREGGKSLVRIRVCGNEGIVKLTVVKKLGMIGHREEVEELLVLDLGKDLVGGGESVRIGGMRVRIADEDPPFAVGIRALRLSYRDLCRGGLAPCRYGDAGAADRFQNEQVFSLSEPLEIRDPGVFRNGGDAPLIALNAKGNNVPRKGSHRGFCEL